MFKSKKLLIISLLLICIFSISMVSASDVSDTDACVDESEVVSILPMLMLHQVLIV